MMTTGEAAQVLKVDRRTVWLWCKRFGFQKKGRDYMLTQEQVEQIRNRPGKRRTRQGELA